MRLNSLDCI